MNIKEVIDSGNHLPILPLTNEEATRYNVALECSFCKVTFIDGNRKMCHHSQLCFIENFVSCPIP